MNCSNGGPKHGSAYECGTGYNKVPGFEDVICPDGSCTHALCCVSELKIRVLVCVGFFYDCLVYLHFFSCSVCWGLWRIFSAECLLQCCLQQHYKRCWMRLPANSCVCMQAHARTHICIRRRCQLVHKVLRKVAGLKKTALRVFFIYQENLRTPLRCWSISSVCGNHTDTHTQTIAKGAEEGVRVSGLGAQPPPLLKQTVLFREHRGNTRWEKIFISVYQKLPTGRHFSHPKSPYSKSLNKVGLHGRAPPLPMGKRRSDTYSTRTRRQEARPSFLSPWNSPPPQSSRAAIWTALRRSRGHATTQSASWRMRASTASSAPTASAMTRCAATVIRSGREHIDKPADTRLSPVASLPTHAYIKHQRLDAGTEA